MFPSKHQLSCSLAGSPVKRPMEGCTALEPYSVPAGLFFIPLRIFKKGFKKNNKLTRSVLEIIPFKDKEAGRSKEGRGDHKDETLPPSERKPRKQGRARGGGRTSRGGKI